MTPSTSGAATAEPGGRRRHPDLAATLLAHGIELARAGGPEAVSLRDVQRRAGASHNAAYRHYHDREALLAAISHHAAARMAEAMSAAQEQAQLATSAADPQTAAAELARGRFRAIGRAYLDFALTEPGLFRTAFLTDPAPKAHSSQGPDPFQLLVDALDDMVTAGALAQERRPFSDIVAWSAVHGLAILLLDGPLRHLDALQQAAAINRLLDIVSAGTH